MRRHGHKSHALIEALHTAQEAYGFLEDDVLRQVAADLRVPLSKAYGVATFYNFFTLKPQGRHYCIVCMGTACYVKRAAEIVAALQKEYSIQAGETTSDGAFSLATARCLGSCGLAPVLLAPVLVLDGDVLPRETPETTLEQVRQHLQRQRQTQPEEVYA